MSFEVNFNCKNPRWAALRYTFAVLCKVHCSWIYTYTQNLRNQALF